MICTSVSTLTANDFYRNLAQELDAQPSFRKPDNFRTIQEEIARISLEKRKTPVIIIDEANYINNAILNDLKILFNFEMDYRDRVAILFAGLSKLNSTLRLAIHEPVYQRLVMNYNLEGLSKEEGRSYIHEKLKGAGCNRTVFHEVAIEAILNVADGTPRIINKPLMPVCLLATVANQKSSLPTSQCRQSMTASLADPKSLTHLMCVGDLEISNKVIIQFYIICWVHVFSDGNSVI